MRSHLRPVAALTAAALATPACAFVEAERPRDEAEVLSRLERLDTHLTATRDAAIDRRHLTGGIVMGLGVAAVGGGLYVRTLEDAQPEDTSAPVEGTADGSAANGLLLLGAVAGLGGLFIFFFPTEAERRANSFLDARADDTRAPFALLQKGEAALQTIALEDGLERLERGVPTLLIGVAVMALSLGAGDDLSTETVAALTTYGALMTLGGGFFVFTPSAAEDRWDAYKKEVLDLQSGAPTPAPTSARPLLSAEGVGIGFSGTF